MIVVIMMRMIMMVVRTTSVVKYTLQNKEFTLNFWIINVLWGAWIALAINRMQNNNNKNV